MKRHVKGLAVPYRAWSTPIEEGRHSFQEQFEAGAFSSYLRSNPRVYLDHEHGFRGCKGELASTDDGSLTVRETDAGLEIEGVLNDTHCAKEVSSAIQRGEMQMSIGFRSKGDVWDALKQRRWIRDAQLTHVSVVRRPQFPQTKIEVRSLLPDLFKQVGDGDLRSVQEFDATMKYVRRFDETDSRRWDGEAWLRRRKFDLLHTAELRSRDTALVSEIRSLLCELVPD